MARDLIRKTRPAAKVSLCKGSGGVFEITVDGRVAYSKKATGRFPTEQEVVAALG